MTADQGEPVAASQGLVDESSGANKSARATDMHSDNLFVIRHTSFSRIQVYLFVDRTREVKAQARGGDLPPSNCIFSGHPVPMLRALPCSAGFMNVTVRESREAARALLEKRRRVWFTPDLTRWEMHCLLAAATHRLCGCRNLFTPTDAAEHAPHKCKEEGPEIYGAR